MTAYDIHDALTLLPGDLVTATDRLRTAPKTRRIFWKRMIPAAACLVVLLSAAMVFYSLPAMGGGKKESMAEAPAAAAPMAPAQMESAADAAVSQESPAENGAVTEEQSVTMESDHRHSFAEDAKAETGDIGGCGNTQATITLKGKAYAIAGGDAIALSRILEGLPYDPALRCRCMAEFTADTELMTGIEVSLADAFARCGLGQASLTEQQVNLLREIVNRLE